MIHFRDFPSGLVWFDEEFDLGNIVPIIVFWYALTHEMGYCCITWWNIPYRKKWMVFTAWFASNLIETLCATHKNCLSILQCFILRKPQTHPTGKVWAFSFGFFFSKTSGETHRRAWSPAQPQLSWGNLSWARLGLDMAWYGMVSETEWAICGSQLLWFWSFEAPPCKRHRASSHVFITQQFCSPPSRGRHPIHPRDIQKKKKQASCLPKCHTTTCPRCLGSTPRRDALLPRDSFNQKSNVCMSCALQK